MLRTLLLLPFENSTVHMLTHAGPWQHADIRWQPPNAAQQQYNNYTLSRYLQFHF
jgi:hypothetical protein